MTHQKEEEFSFSQKRFNIKTIYFQSFQLRLQEYASTRKQKKPYLRHFIIDKASISKEQTAQKSIITDKIRLLLNRINIASQAN